MVSVNQFSILCEGENVVAGSGLGGIHRYGGPILFLILWIMFLLFVLSQIDAGFRIPWSRSTRLLRPAGDLEKLDDYAPKTTNPDVLAEVEHANSPSTTDPLRVLNISKFFGSNKVVDNVSFTIPKSSLFVLLGPNGAEENHDF
jgi:ATP-binding cassette subfamily A (ABC1) protein 3